VVEGVGVDVVVPEAGEGVGAELQHRMEEEEAQPEYKNSFRRHLG
jgi:hypothetical protein